MADLNEDRRRRRPLANTIGLILSGLVGIVWAVYGLTGAPQWLLVVAVVWTMLVGIYWAFGRQLIPDRRKP